MSTQSPPLPFQLPARERVRRIRKLGPGEVSESPRQRLTGFEPRFTDIVDYIVRITDEIWQARAIGYIRDTYDADCAVYSQYGVTRTAEAVVRSTLASIAAAPDGDTHHLNVAWDGDDRAGFYTAHLGFGGATNVAPSAYGPATGRSYTMRFAADCVSCANKIHTEWLVRDAGAMVRQLGLDVDDAARRVAELPVAEPYTVATPATPRMRPEGPLNAWVFDLVESTWNARRFDRTARFYADDVVVHWAGGRTVQGRAGLSQLMISLLAAIPDGRMQVEHACWSDETDGVIVAIRWTLVGESARGGALGRELPVGRPVYVMGSSHLRVDGSRIVEEWTVFDEVATIAQAYRA